MKELPINYAEVEAIYGLTIGSGYKTLAITSSTSGEGKSTVAQAIVERSHAIRKKVLLVDTNTLDPALSKIYLKNTFDQDLSKKYITSDNTRVKDNKIFNIYGKSISVIPAPQNMNDVMLYREVDILKKSIKKWLESYDCVIFDTSALNSKNQSNIPAEIICEVCSGALLVVEAGETPANLICESIDKLNLKKVNLIGSILNDKNNPTLLADLQRETHRLDSFLPNFMAKLRKKLARLIILNVAI